MQFLFWTDALKKPKRTVTVIYHYVAVIYHYKEEK